MLPKQSPARPSSHINKTFKRRFKATDEATAAAASAMAAAPAVVHAAAATTGPQHLQPAEQHQQQRSQQQQQEQPDNSKIVDLPAWLLQHKPYATPAGASPTLAGVFGWRAARIREHRQESRHGTILLYMAHKPTTSSNCSTRQCICWKYHLSGKCAALQYTRSVCKGYAWH